MSTQRPAGLWPALLRFLHAAELIVARRAGVKQREVEREPFICGGCAAGIRALAEPCQLAGLRPRTPGRRVGQAGLTRSGRHG